MARIVVALGGNALLKRGEEMTADNQRRNAVIAAQALVPRQAEDMVDAVRLGPGHDLLAR